MKNNFDNSQISNYNELFKKVLPVLEEMQASQNYESEYASLDLLGDSQHYQKSLELSQQFEDYDVLVVIGIGGSNLGAQAIYEALSDRVKKTLYFADTTDTYAIKQLMKSLEYHIKNNEKICLNVISKSGTTTETIANFYVLYDFLKQQNQNVDSSVIVTTDTDSALDEIAQKKHFHRLLIPSNVGGRYSVFSTVGLFPLCFSGINCEQLLKGAYDMKRRCILMEEDNPAILSAIALYSNYYEGRTIVNSFIFATALRSFGLWYRQLLAESIGKTYSRDNEEVRVGLMPVYSIGSTDLHSVAQLYLGGPDMTYHTFIYPSVSTSPEIIPVENFESLLPQLSGSSLDRVLTAIYGGVKEAFIKAQIPFDTIELEELNEYELGRLFIYKMIEVMILGALFEINPFDQPAVELYKKETKQLL